jgi:hypothetical protein
MHARFWQFLVLCLMFFPMACRGMDEVYYLPVELSDSAAGDSASYFELVGGMDSSTWRSYTQGRVSFKYPTGWKVREAMSPRGAFFSAVLTDTEKEVITGVAPEDFYTNGGRNNKYAETYKLITVDAYDGYSGKSWADFLRDHYRGIVSEYEPYVIADIPLLDSIRAKRIAGIYRGEPRLFVRSGDRIYDIALFTGGTGSDEARKELYSFLREFSY